MNRVNSINTEGTASYATQWKTALLQTKVAEKRRLLSLLAQKIVHENGENWSAQIVSLPDLLNSNTWVDRVQIAVEVAPFIIEKGESREVCIGLKDFFYQLQIHDPISKEKEKAISENVNLCVQLIITNLIQSQQGVLAKIFAKWADQEISKTNLYLELARKETLSFKIDRLQKIFRQKK